jgi:6-phosphogluconolactonase
VRRQRSTPEVRILENAEAVARAAADMFRRRAADTVNEYGLFTVVLSGGNTPRLLFRELAGNSPGNLPWEHIHLFWSDERYVPPDHPDSNFRLVQEELLSRITLPAVNIHRMHGENPDPTSAAADYEVELRSFFGLQPGQLPRFDLIFLGMGADGHTASLFPGSEALAEAERLVVTPWVAQVKVRRLTLTAPVLNHAAYVVFLVTGAEKAKTLLQVLEGPHDPLNLPCQLIEPDDGELVWLMDNSAAQLLSPRSPERR